MKNLFPSLLFSLIILSCIGRVYGQTQKVKISTEYGDMIAILYDQTPLHRDNFIKLAKDSFFDGTIFHRVINKFMIQGGDPTSKNAAADAQLGNGGPGYTLPAEINSKFIHKKGALAAARMGDQINPKKESSGSQFYIVHGDVANEANLNALAERKAQSIKGKYTQAFLTDTAHKQLVERLRKLQLEKNQEGIKAFFAEIDPQINAMIKPGEKFTGYTKEQIETYAKMGGTPFLDNDYTVFGEVIEGLDVIDKIAAVEMGINNRPIKDVKMKVTLLKK